jgi:hypothetical protein
MWIDLSGRACGLRDSRAASVSDLRPVLESARRVFHPRAARADETSAGRLNRSRRLSSTVAPAWALSESDKDLSEKSTVSMVDSIKTADQARPGTMFKLERKTESVHAGDHP